MCTRYSSERDWEISITLDLHLNKHNMLDSGSKSKKPKSPVWEITILLQRILILIFQIYQWFISPLFPPICRFHPNCSQYAIQAVHQWGILKGLGLTIIRLLKCNPLFSGGYDPVPDPEQTVLGNISETRDTRPAQNLKTNFFTSQSKILR